MLFTFFVYFLLINLAKFYLAYLIVSKLFLFLFLSCRFIHVGSLEEEKKKSDLSSITEKEWKLTFRTGNDIFMEFSVCFLNWHERKKLLYLLVKKKEITSEEKKGKEKRKRVNHPLQSPIIYLYNFSIPTNSDLLPINNSA